MNRNDSGSKIIIGEKFIMKQCVSKPHRFRRARNDASIRAVLSNFVNLYGLPAGCVKFVKPNGRKMRVDASISALRRDWAKHEMQIDP
jgi:hypothetical protein